jgi:hypothetical protein
MPLSHVSYFKDEGLLQITVDPAKATNHTAAPPQNHYPGLQSSIRNTFWRLD